MAIYHFSGTIISRSQGRSSVSAAAYRSGQVLFDERQGRYHHYTQKKDVVYTAILAPEVVPNWATNRETLWNAVERIEKRKDSQLAREFTLALPNELTLDENISLIESFVKQQWVSQGMIADVCVHQGKTADGQAQVHAHVMLTLREINEKGFGKKVRQWNAKENLLTWREEWANTVNFHLAKAGLEMTVDHRTLEQQGIFLEPQHKIGSINSRGDSASRLADHQRIARENGERIRQDPNIALDAMTKYVSTFTHQDLALLIHRHTENSEQFQAVYETVKASPNLIRLGLDAKQRDRFTTVTMLGIEQSLIEKAIFLHHKADHNVDNSVKINTLTQYPNLTPEQVLAFNHITTQGDLHCVIGFAGTGKSYLLQAAREAWEKQGFHVVGGALSGIAAQNLSGSSGIPSQTLAHYQYYWDKGEQYLTANMILVVDEAGMIGSRQMEKILTHVQDSGAKLVLMGDPEQLQAIEAGASFRAMTDRIPYVSLMDIQRQRESWQKRASQELALSQTDKALNRYDAHDHLHGFTLQMEARFEMVKLWNEVRLSNPDVTQIILAFTRKEVNNLNHLARQLRRENGELTQDCLIQTERGEKVFSVNDRVYFLKNNSDLGVKNGSLGTIKALTKHEMTVQLDAQGVSKSSIVNVTLADYHHIDYGYAATFHKSQGVTVDRSYVLTSQYLDRHTTYVGVTRHTVSCDIFWSQQAFKDKQALVMHLQRERQKDVSLDYIISDFSDQRHVKVTGYHINPSVLQQHAAMKQQALETLKKDHPMDYALVQKSFQAFKVTQEASKLPNIQLDKQADEKENRAISPLKKGLNQQQKVLENEMER